MTQVGNQPRRDTVTTPAVIDDFRGRWSFLSNFHPSPLVWDGGRYPTAEHAFNAGKTLEPERRRLIAQAASPREAKKRGRSVPLRPGWDERVRYEVMAAVLQAKFTGAAPVAALLSTGDALLVEGNRWHDQHWGDCRCGRTACRGAGENHLGRLLMELRAELAAQVSGGDRSPPVN
jgi:ribA/ribD-fused uncharacterized protein